MRQRFLVVVAALVGLLAALVSPVPATADSPVPDPHDTVGKETYKGAPKAIWDKRVSDQKVSGNPRQARRDANLIYGGAWLRITDFDRQQMRTLESLITFVQGLFEAAAKAGVDPGPTPEFRKVTAKEFRRNDRALYKTLRQQGLLRGNDLVLQAVGSRAELWLAAFAYRLDRIGEMTAREKDNVKKHKGEIEGHMKNALPKEGGPPNGILFGLDDKSGAVTKYATYVSKGNRVDRADLEPTSSPHVNRDRSKIPPPHVHEPVYRPRPGKSPQHYGEKARPWSIADIEKHLAPDSIRKHTPSRLIYGVVERAHARPFKFLHYLIRHDTKAGAKRGVADLILGMYLYRAGKWLKLVAFADDGTPVWRLAEEPFKAPSAPPEPEPGTATVKSSFQQQLESVAQDSGGIDFTTLELRYLAEAPADGKVGLEYAFTGDPGGSPSSQDFLQGARSADETSDAFFVWLALPTSTFWVNLNPNEPDRIVDPRLGRTNVGQVMLEADLRLKETVGELIHPDTRLGKQFWDSLLGEYGDRCFSSRSWITPKTATVYDHDGELYILDAPLDVKMEQEYIQDFGNGKHQSCPYQPAYVEEHNAEVYRDLVLPRLVETVNNAPEYAELRRVYLSRIAAEWYRQRDQVRPMEYSSLIDSGDVDSWPLTGDWTPRDTFDDYVTSYTEGEFNVTRAGSVYTYGGVDFSTVPRQNVTKAEFERLAPDRATISGALAGASTDHETQQVWFGGTTVAPADQKRPEASASDAADRQPLFVIGWVVAALACFAVPLGILVRRRIQRAGERTW